MRLRPIVLTAALLLAACGGSEKSAEGERKNAAGTVLGGSITDDMLPLDTVTSQSPPLSESGGDGTGDGGKAGDPANAPPRDSSQGPGDPPRDKAPAPSAPSQPAPAPSENDAG